MQSQGSPPPEDHSLRTPAHSLKILAACFAIAIVASLLTGFVASPAGADVLPHECGNGSNTDLADSECQDALRENNPAAEDSGSTEGTAEDSGGGEQSGGSGDYGFAEVDDSQPAYKQYTITDYKFAFFQPDTNGIAKALLGVLATLGNEIGTMFAEMNNGYASMIFMIHVLLMKLAFVVLEWVLTLNLVTTLEQTISTGMSDIGNEILGSPGAFTGFVKVMWALGVAALVLYLLKGRVAEASGRALQMIGVTAIAIIIVMMPGKVIDYYAGFTNDISSGMLSLASGEQDSSDPDSTVTEGFLDRMWTPYVLVPWGQIQISSDTGIATQYAEPALATSGEDRPDALEKLAEDEPTVEERASVYSYVMHQVWAIATIIFGICTAAIMLFIAGAVLMYQLIALIALMTMPVWLLFAIFPGGGVTAKTLGWFLALTVDVILAHLMLALFVLVNDAVLSINTPNEDMALILRFLIAIFSGIAVIMMIFSGRSILKNSLTGRSVRSGGGGMLAANLLAQKSGNLASASAAAVRGGSSSGSSPTDSSTGYLSPKVQDAKEHAASGSGTDDSDLDAAETELNEKRRAAAGAPQLDDRSKQDIRKDKRGRFAGLAKNVGWKTADGTIGAAGKVGKVGWQTAKRLPAAGLISARSGFMPFETAAAFGGVGAVAAGGAAKGAVGAHKDKARERLAKRAEQRRQRKQEEANAELYTSEEGRDAHDTLAASQLDSWEDEYDKAVADAENEANRYGDYFEEPPITERGEEGDDPRVDVPESSPSTAADPRAASGEDNQPGTYQRPRNIPEDANFNAHSGAVWGTYDPSTNQTPTPPPGYSGSSEVYQNPPNADGSSVKPSGMYLFTPLGATKPDRKHHDHRDLDQNQRMAAYEANERERRAARDSSPLRQGNSPEAIQRRENDRIQDAIRDNQREGIARDGYTSFDDWHSDNMRRQFGERPTHPTPGESTEGFMARAEDYDNNVANYDPTDYTPGAAPTDSGERQQTRSKIGESQAPQPKRVHRDSAWLQKNDPERWNKHLNQNLSERLSPQQISAVQEARRRDADPAETRSAYDQPVVQEAASARLKDNIRSGLHTKEEMETGMKRPDETDNAGWSRFRQSLATARQARRRHEPTDPY